MSGRDGVLDDALSLVRAFKTDPDGFTALVTATDCVEHHQLIVRLCQLVRIATRGDLYDLAGYVEVMQEHQP